MSVLRRATAAAAAATAVGAAGAGLLAGAPPALAQPAAVVRVVIDALTPITPTPRSTLRISGTVTNEGSAPLTGLSGELLLGQAPVPDRAALHADESLPPTQLAPVAGARLAFPDRLGPHARRGFHVRVALADLLSPNTFGVYPLAVRLDAAGAPVGEADTFLPWAGFRPASPLHVVLLWPIDDAPALAADGRLTGTALAREIAPGGRLRTLVDDGLRTQRRSPSGGGSGGLRLTWMVEPSLLSAVQAMRRPYFLTGGVRAMRADPNASSFLSALSGAPDRGELVALPYGDPDLVALQRAGLTQDLTTAFPLGVRITEAVLHRRPTTGVAWPAGGELDEPTLSSLAGAGVGTVVLSDRQLPAPLSASPPTATAVTRVSTAVPGLTERGLATDSALSRLLQLAGRSAASPRMAAQLLIAETALIVAENPNGATSRDLVLAPPRYWNPQPDYVEDLLTGLTRADWLTSVTLAGTAHDPVGDRSSVLTGTEQADDEALPTRTLASGSASSVGTLRAVIDSLSRMFGTPTVLAPEEAALYRAESVAWRTDPAGGFALREEVFREVEAIRHGVQVVSAPRITLTAHHTTLPVTIANNLHRRVTVILRVISPDPSDLQTTATQPETVGPGQKLEVRLDAHTQRSGRFTVGLQITTPDGLPLARPTELVVNSTAYGPIAIAITLTALGVLGLAILVRLVRRVRARPAPTGDVLTGRPG